MALTKPAACAIQMFGAPLFILGVLAAIKGSVCGGPAFAVVGLILLWIGRQPATK